MNAECRKLARGVNYPASVKLLLLLLPPPRRRPYTKRPQKPFSHRLFDHLSFISYPRWPTDPRLTPLANRRAFRMPRTAMLLFNVGERREGCLIASARPRNATEVAVTATVRRAPGLGARWLATLARSPLGLDNSPAACRKELLHGGPDSCTEPSRRSPQVLIGVRLTNTGSGRGMRRTVGIHGRGRLDHGAKTLTCMIRIAFNNSTVRRFITCMYAGLEG